MVSSAIKTVKWIAFVCPLLSFTIVNSQDNASKTSLQNKFIGFNNKKISTMGRVNLTDSCTEIYWNGSSVSINVSKTQTVSALISDERDNSYYYVIIDGQVNNALKVKFDKGKKVYHLASNLNKEKHKIELFKIGNTDFTTTRLFGFELDKNAMVLEADKKPKRKIEFYGNSITSGHGVDVPVDSADSGKPEFFNNYKTYGALTARHFDAQYHCIAKSGIGLTVSWFPEIMPEIFDRLNPKNPNSKWNFSKYQPDIVVVNLFQNDSWIVNQPEHLQFKARFGTVKPTEDFIIKAYADFIRSVRSKYPKAQIICSLGNMDITREGSKWPSYVEQAVRSLSDQKVVVHFFPYKNSNGHPKIKEQQMMADDLIAFIEKNKYWK
ncbi:electron transporter RnfD [Pedobacter frigiditerrae]|uniref:Electron transporter RnfD n=2 Tax=Pedobacter frigiditerrae TaxID=2530452 RepID=A0A4R0MPQ8_9SPHI|nr:electron transporter RnfD [Pedobacter frigiditerrae]